MKEHEAMKVHEDERSVFLPSWLKNNISFSVKFVTLHILHERSAFIPSWLKNIGSAATITPAT
jgi:hypothetical protein